MRNIVMKLMQGMTLSLGIKYIDYLIRKLLISDHNELKAKQNEDQEEEEEIIEKEDPTITSVIHIYIASIHPSIYLSNLSIYLSI